MSQLRTALKGSPSCRATCGISWGFTGTALQLSFYLCSILLHSLLFHEYWSWMHSSVNFPHTNLLKLRFWGNPTGDNILLSPVSWTHYMLVTRHMTNCNSWTCHSQHMFFQKPVPPLITYFTVPIWNYRFTYLYKTETFLRSKFVWFLIFVF